MVDKEINRPIRQYCHSSRPLFALLEILKEKSKRKEMPMYCGFKTGWLYRVDIYEYGGLPLLIDIVVIEVSGCAIVGKSAMFLIY